MWRLLLELAGRVQQVHLQWVPAHCGMTGKRADTLAKEAAALPQDCLLPPWNHGPSPLTRAVARRARVAWQQTWPSGLYRSIGRPADSRSR